MALRVLVADDEPFSADMIELILVFKGFEVTSARDGLEALARAREEQPDVILLDVRMPELSGEQVSRHLKSDPQLSKKVVVLFSCLDEGDIDWRAAGADAFLQKPIDLRVLPDIVDRLLATRAVQPEAP